jgi:phospholipid/cholesterol/gamma-HCH transport system permease protein
MADQTTTPWADVAPRFVRRNPFVALLRYIGEIAILLGQTVREIARGRIDARDLVQQMASLGADSIPIAVLTTFATGAVLALYFAPYLKQYGEESLVGMVVAVAMSRELGPVLTGVVVAARAGSTVAAEIATMSVTEQIDALRALAVSPVRYLVAPRLLAALIMLPMVCAFADAAGIYGGYLLAVYREHVPAASFPSSIRQFLQPSDFYLGMVKTLVFGMIIALVGCHQGLKTRGGATEVGQATTNAVVISIVLIYIANFLLALGLFDQVPTI